LAFFENQHIADVRVVGYSFEKLFFDHEINLCFGIFVPHTADQSGGKDNIADGA
jgi:hypothetical protein